MRVELKVTHEDYEVSAVQKLDSDYTYDIAELVAEAVKQVSRALNLDIRTLDEYYPQAAALLEAEAERLDPTDYKEVWRLKEAAQALYPNAVRDGD